MALISTVPEGRGHLDLRLGGRRSRPSRVVRGSVAWALLAIALLGAACSSPSGSSSGSATITLYNGQHQQTTAALVKAFEAKTGINVNVRNNGEAVLANQIITEGSSSPADVIYTENSPIIEQLQERNLLAPVDRTTLARVPAQYNSPTGHWVGVSARVSVMAYNTGQLSPAQLPSSVMDLANPKWKGKLGLAPGETDFLPIVISIERTYGKRAAASWLAGIKTNAGGNIFPDNETLTNEINQGHVELGIIDAYYWYRRQAEVGAAAMHSSVATFAAGDAGYLINISGAGVLASSSQKAAGQKFLAFLVSVEGQEIIAHSQSYEYPIGSGVATAQPLPPLGSLHPAPLTIAEVGDGSAATTLLQQAGLA
jgi:iron(III) transport system substrate-binding protein